VASLQLYAIVEKHTADRIAASRPLPMLSVLARISHRAAIYSNVFSRGEQLTS
jgi:hypothetical protein